MLRHAPCDRCWRGHEPGVLARLCVQVPEGGLVLPQELGRERQRGVRAGGASSFGWFGDDASREVKEVLVDFPEGAHLLFQLAHLDRQMLLVSYQVL